MDGAPGLVPNSRVSATKDGEGSSSPTKKASRLEPQIPAKLPSRAMPRSPSQGPHTPALHEAVAVFSRASPHSPGVRASSPTASCKDLSEIQDGRWCAPRRCSCCWASTKASGSGSPLEHSPESLQNQDAATTVLLQSVGWSNCAQQGNT